VAPTGAGLSASAPTAPRRRWLRWARVLFAGLGLLVVFAAVFWSLRIADWIGPTVVSSHAAPARSVYAVIVRTQRGLSIFMTECRLHVMLNDAPALAAGRQDFAYWDRAVLVAPCTAARAPVWLDDARLRIALEVPQRDVWNHVNWRSGDEARNIDVDVVFLDAK
jgi:hypothetical protein